MDEPRRRGALVGRPRRATGRSGAAPAPAQLTLVGGTTELSDAALRALLEEIDALDAVPLAEPADEASLVEEG